MKKIFYFTLAIMVLFCSCAKDDGIGGTNGSKNKTDVAVTGGLADLGSSMVDFYGYVNLNMITVNYEDLSIGVEYSLNENFDKSYIEEEENGISNDNRFEVSVDGGNQYLIPDTTYYYRTIVKVFGSKSKYTPLVVYTGKTASFKTKSFSNIATISDPINVTINSADFIIERDTRKIPLYKGEAEDVDVLIYYSADNNSYDYEYVEFYDKNTNTANITLNNLEPNKTYYYYIATRLGKGVKKGEKRTFSTESKISDFTTDLVTITNNKSTITCISKSIVSATDYGVYYSTKREDLSNLNNCFRSRAEKHENGKYNVEIDYLSSATTYYYCAYLKYNDNYYTSEIKTFNTTESNKTHESVDLGLSVKWATCNVGAISPEDHGDRFAWAETTPKEWADDDEENYTFYKNGKYTSLWEISTSTYDVATVKWGNNWRMPTSNEMEELNKHCHWTWTTMNGISGYKIVGPNNNSIFLPQTYSVFGIAFGYYWSSSQASETNAYGIGFSYMRHDTGGMPRYSGYSIRPVTE